MKLIHDWKITFKNYLYTYSFVVQVLIFQIEFHLLMMDKMTIKKNMMMGPKSFFINNVKQLIKFCNGLCVTPPPPPIVVNNIIHVFCEKMGHLENK